MPAHNEQEKSRSSARSMIATWLVGFVMGLCALALFGGGGAESVSSLGPSSVLHDGGASVAELTPVVAAPPSCREDEAAWSAAFEGLTANLQLAAKVANLESAIEALRTGAIDGPSFVRAAVHTIPEQELKDILAATTRLDGEHLDGIDDMRAYAVRLADIAMEGVLADDTEPMGVSPVAFSTRQEGRRATWTMAGRFGPTEDRLYAFFDTTDWPSGEVMVRWRHIESGDVLLLEQHRVRAGDPRGFVWLSRSGGWDAGAYQVDVYSDDEALWHLASGRYAVN